MTNTYVKDTEQQNAFNDGVQGFFQKFAKECRKSLYEPYHRNVLSINEDSLILRREYFRAAEYSTRT